MVRDHGRGNAASEESPFGKSQKLRADSAELGAVCLALMYSHDKLNAFVNIHGGKAAE
jgi:hypothetical protein